MKRGRELPAPDWRRCDAIAKPAHRCSNYATRRREGYQLCWQHFEQANVRYSPDAHRFRRVHEYAAMMVVALGDDEAGR